MKLRPHPSEASSFKPVLVASRVVCVPIFHAQMVDGVGRRVGFTASRMVLAVEMITVFWFDFVGGTSSVSHGFDVFVRYIKWW
jgi:hypothetical protein